MDIVELRRAIEAVADPEQAEPMAAYMKHRFRFLGAKAPAIRLAAKPTLAAGAEVDRVELLRFVDQLWDQPEREFQYVGCQMMRKWVGKLEAADIVALERYIVTKSWWDTVDSLAAWSVGPLVQSFPELVSVMDRWIDSDDIWLARTAIIHQLGYKAETDADRLFRYAELRAEDTEFFIRKAIGWALRQYARQNPDEVRSFVAANEDRLSGLSKREALKHLDP
ncbi:MAG: DNA alkylation repair protein [Acidimicrobiales bacterium]